MKKAAWLVAITITSVMAFSPVQVYAGEINSAEAGVISYCSQTFHYRGKEYKATAAALSALRSKLASDDVDLTPAQAAKAKSMVDANIATGVSSGHLVEVGSNGEATASPSPEASKKPTATKEPEKSEQTEAPKETAPTIEKDPTTSNDYDASYIITGNMDDAKEKDLPVTKEEYLTSDITVGDGKDTIYSASLPIKNTGYNMKMVWNIVISLVVVLGITLFVACRQILFARNHEKK